MKKFTSLLLLTLALSGYAESSTQITPDGEAAGHTYVDLGLPSGTLWATCNIAAESPYHPGQYFAWGETNPRDFFEWKDYEFFEEEYSDANGHTTYSATDIGRQISGTQYDAARAQWGDAWRTPTKEEWEELISSCRAEYKTVTILPPKAGLYLWGPNGNKIVLSLTVSQNSIDHCIDKGEYWTATADTEQPDGNSSAMILSFNPTTLIMNLKSEVRHKGFAIRPVISSKDATAVRTLTEAVPAMTFADGRIAISGNADGCQVTLSDLSGRQVFASSATNDASPAPSLPKGIYIATLSKGDKAISTLKIAVK
ncbi:MAG: T9SS type A sorting domain-containing protein [Muribaculaceae bacterium]|nr:T9SS type A sorting domain-containing protein [Muribaculaceae bacterium]